MHKCERNGEEAREPFDGSPGTSVRSFGQFRLMSKRKRSQPGESEENAAQLSFRAATFTSDLDLFDSVLVLQEV